MSAHMCHILNIFQRNTHGLFRLLTKNHQNFLYPTCRLCHEGGTTEDGNLRGPNDLLYEESDDYFGLGNLELNQSRSVVSNVTESSSENYSTEKVDKSKIFEKHDLIDNLKSKDDGNGESIYSLPYGFVRFDSNSKKNASSREPVRKNDVKKINKLTSPLTSDDSHPEVQTVKHNKRPKINIKKSHLPQNVIEEQYFPNHSNINLTKSENEIEASGFHKASETENLCKSFSHGNFIDEQYFPDYVSEVDVNNTRKTNQHHRVSNLKQTDQFEPNFTHVGSENKTSNIFPHSEDIAKDLAIDENSNNRIEKKSDCDFNYVDQQYFESEKSSTFPLEKQYRPGQNFSNDDSFSKESLNTSDVHGQDLSYIDQQYLLQDQSSSEGYREISTIKDKFDEIDLRQDTIKKNISINQEQTKIIDESRDNLEIEYSFGVNDKIPQDHILSGDSKQDGKEKTDKDTKRSKETKWKQNKRQTGRTIDRESTTSAYKQAMEIRNKETDKGTGIQIHGIPEKMMQRDSQGYLILKDQVPRFDCATSSEIVETLLGGVLYDSNDIVAINKPYGLACQPGTDVGLSMTDFLDKLARGLDRRLDTLYTVHRLDKNTTGVYLLAKTEVMAAKLKAAFKNREVIKKYWVLTCGVPDPKKGVIDIPLSEGTVGKRIRMVCLPEYSVETKVVMSRPSVQQYKAVTRYKVLRDNGNCALLECQTETGVKHQIRSHLFFGLNTPILGDHKYSHLTKFAPQRIPTDILHRLKVRQSKARYIPMHLHAKAILIPEFLDGKNFYVKCRLPRHFSDNMRKVKINAPLYG